VAEEDDRIKVAGGVFTTQAPNVALISRGVSIQGGFSPDFSICDPDAHETVLDGQWHGSVVTMTNAGIVELEGLTITHGDRGAEFVDWRDTGGGGGIYAVGTQLSVIHCTVVDNIGSSVEQAAGGGIYVQGFHVPLTIRDCRIASNVASTAHTGWGGGMYLRVHCRSADVVVSGNVFEGNLASNVGWGQGGAAYLQSQYTLRDNVFVGNHGSTASQGLGQGGATYLWCTDSGVMESNRFLNNVASVDGPGYGGALFARCSMSVTLFNNLLVDNRASVAGDGLHLDTFSPEHIDALVVNNTLVRTGSAIDSEAVLVGVNVSLEMSNNIIAGYALGITNTAPLSNTLSATRNLFWNDDDPIMGEEPVVGDPLLAEDYDLLPGSPAIDAGLPMDWLTHDILGRPRSRCRRYDIGAFEVGGDCLSYCLPMILNR
jgi:hypothetical protein